MVDSQDKEAWEQSQLEQASAYRLQLEANGGRAMSGLGATGVDELMDYPENHMYFLGEENSLLKDQVTSLTKTVTRLSVAILFLVIVDLVLLLAFGL